MLPSALARNVGSANLRDGNSQGRPWRQTEMTMTRMAAGRVAAGLATTILAAMVATAAAAAAPLISQGIGTASCERLAADIKPAEGLGNPVNLVLMAWVQGYVSAANISLLEDDGRHVDMNTLDEARVLTEIQAFCKVNPDKKPVAAIDALIRKSHKVKTTWEPGTVQWDEDE
jgi:hypothetical protein